MPPNSADPAKGLPVVAWGLGAWTAAQFVGSLLAGNPTAASVAQAAIAEWGADRAGVTWTGDRPVRQGARAAAARAARGAALGAAVAGGCAIAAWLARTARVASGPEALPTTVSPLVLGCVIAALGAARDELLLRGVVLRATRGRMPPWATLVVLAAAAVASRLGVDTPRAPVLAGVLARDAFAAVALGSLWLRGTGALEPVAALSAFRWVEGTVLRGGLLDLRFTGDPAEDIPSTAVVAGVAVAAAVWALRSPDRARSVAVPPARREE